MVVTAALLETLETARTVLEQAGWEVEVVQLQVSRSHPLAGGTALQALNPVWIVTGYLRGEPAMKERSVNRPFRQGKSSPSICKGRTWGIWPWTAHVELSLPIKHGSRIRRNIT